MNVIDIPLSDIPPAESVAERINQGLKLVSSLNFGETYEPEYPPLVPGYPLQAYRLKIEGTDGPLALDRPIMLQPRSHAVCNPDEEGRPILTSPLYFNRVATVTGTDDNGSRYGEECIVTRTDFFDITKSEILDASWSGGIFSRIKLPLSKTEPDLGYVDGSMVQLIGNRITLNDVEVRYWRRGRAFGISGDDIVLNNPIARFPDNVIASAGIRVVAGKRFRCFGGDITANDDALVFAPGAISVFPRGDLSIEDGAFIGTKAHGVRAINASLGASGTKPDDDETDATDGTEATQIFGAGDWASDDLGRRATASVRNVRFVRITGTATGAVEGNADRGNARAVKIVNESSSGVVDGVSIIDCTITSMPQIDRPFIARNYAGGVSNINIVNLELKDYKKESESQPQRQLQPRQPVSVEQVDGFSWVGGSIAPSQMDGDVTVELLGVRNAWFKDVAIGAKGADTIVLAQDHPLAKDPDDADAPDPNVFGLKARDCENVSIENCRIAVATGSVGVHAQAAVASDVTRCAFTRTTSDALGLSTAAIVFDAGTTARCYAEENVVTALETDTNGIVRTPVRFDPADGNRARRNEVAQQANFGLADGAVQATSLDASVLMYPSITLPAMVLIDPGQAAVVRLTATSDKVVNAMRGPRPGRVITLENVASPTSAGHPAITIVSGGGTDPTRSFLLDANRVLAPGQALTVWYDGIDQRWRAVD